jgi:L-ascorbate metabolism protein UlaG (beta-lactamase superfamily)
MKTVNQMNTKLTVTSVGHSCFLIQTERMNLIFDYYTDKLGIINPGVFCGVKTFVFVSHNHRDHYNPDIFNWRDYGEVIFILEKDCEIPDSVTGKDQIHVMAENERLDIGGAVAVETFGSTDIGVSFLVTVKTDTSGFTVFHAGDLNDWYWADESTPEELAQDEENYLRIIRRLHGRKIDVAFIPKDPRLGEHALRGIRFFDEIVKPDRIIPMHYPNNEGGIFIHEI